VLSPTQQSCALVATGTALALAGGCLCGYLISKIENSRDSKDKKELNVALLITLAGVCIGIAVSILPYHEQIWRFACLCDSTAPGAKKHLIIYLNKFHRSLGSRTVYAMSKDLFDKYVTNYQFYGRCSAGFGTVAGIVSGLVGMSYYNSKKKE